MKVTIIYGAALLLRPYNCLVYTSKKQNINPLGNVKTKYSAGAMKSKL